MATPKRKKTPSTRGMRRSHDRLKATSTAECKNCGAPKLPHHVCKACGFYEDKEVVAKKATAA